VLAGAVLSPKACTRVDPALLTLPARGTVTVRASSCNLDYGSVSFGMAETLVGAVLEMATMYYTFFSLDEPTRWTTKDGLHTTHFVLWSTSSMSTGSGATHHTDRPAPDKEIRSALLELRLFGGTHLCCTAKSLPINANLREDGKKILRKCGWKDTV
jgi:hypothetical protein